MTRASVGDKGLARRLGQKIFVTKKSVERQRTYEGTLVYYPDKFAVLSPSKRGRTPIVEGDTVELRIGSVHRKRRSPHYREHVYII